MLRSDPLSSFWSRIPMRNWRIMALVLLALAIWGSVGLAIFKHIDLVFALPVMLVLGMVVIYDYRPVFYLLIFSIPFSLHVELGATLAIDMPTEPLMIIMLFIFILESLSGRQFKRKGKIYGFHLLILLIIFWAGYTTLLSEIPARSIKYLLAKMWYLASFVYMAQRVIQTSEDVKRVFWAFFSSMLLVVIFVTIRHAAVGFSFEEAHAISYPMYLNGVYYAATLAMFMPWLYHARSWYSPKSLQWYFIIAGIVLFLIAIITAYKRMGWVAVLSGPIVYFLIRRKLFERLIYVGIVFLTLLVSFLVYGNNFYYFSPNYQQTVWHKDDLEGHLQATFEGTEISGVERFYRWVAAKNMTGDMPFFGAGPGTFYPVYQEYTDESFKTYVSDNPEQSTCHNYYLQTFSEQGFVGGLLFLFLNVFMLIKGYRAYHFTTDPTRKGMVMMAIMSLTTIQLFLLLNELVEVDKIGPMYWLCLVIIHKTQVWHEAEA